MKQCPICNRKLYEAVGGGFFCKNCGFVNDPNYLKKCLNCNKIVPNFRSERAKTCSLKCSHDWSHLSEGQREEKRKNAK